jgi:hypothetical protein
LHQITEKSGDHGNTENTRGFQPDLFFAYDRADDQKIGCRVYRRHGGNGDEEPYYFVHRLGKGLADQYFDIVRHVLDQLRADTAKQHVAKPIFKAKQTQPDGNQKDDERTESGDEHIDQVGQKDGNDGITQKTERHTPKKALSSDKYGKKEHFCDKNLQNIPVCHVDGKKLRPIH